jgi:hypothetical protein
MLAIPVIKCESTLNTVPFKAYLQKQGCYRDDLIQHDLIKFEQLHRDALTFTEPSMTNQENLLRYHYQIKSLIPRVEGIQGEVQLSNTWVDAYQQTRKLTSHNLYITSACLLWNLGANESMLGAKLDRSTDEGIRGANKHFQQAASYFEYLKDNILPHCKENRPVSASQYVLPCLSADCLNMVKLLMFAQGQLCFYEKAIKDKKNPNVTQPMKPSIICKLAKQVASFYQQASVATRSAVLAPILDVSWYHITEFQHQCFNGIAYYWQSIASKEAALTKGRGYNEEVLYLSRAENILQHAVAFHQQHKLLSIQSLLHAAESLLMLIQTTKNTSVKDLGTIYMEAVLADNGSYPDVTGLVMVKILPLPPSPPSTLPIASPATPTVLFSYLIPVELLSINTNFLQSLQSLYHQIQQEIEDYKSVGKTALHSLGLPTSIDLLKTTYQAQEVNRAGGTSAADYIPEALWLKITKIQGMGDIKKLQSLYNQDFQLIIQRVKSQLEMIRRSIQYEEENDAQFQQSCGGVLATVTAATPGSGGSKQASKDVFQRENVYANMSMYEKLVLDTQQQQDREIAQQLQTFVTSNQSNDITVKRYDWVTKTKDQLNALFPTSVPAGYKKPSTTAAATTPGVVEDLINLDFDDYQQSSGAKGNNENLSDLVSHPTVVALEQKLIDFLTLFQQYDAIGQEIGEYQHQFNYMQIMQGLLNTGKIETPNTSAVTTTAAADTPTSGEGGNPVETYRNYTANLLQSIQSKQVMLQQLGKEQQGKVLQEIITYNTQFHALQENNTLFQLQKQVIQSIEDNCAEYWKLYTQLTAGIQFYNNILVSLYFFFFFFF